jgi:O-methyltransferase involved in polyketide biosynthesis
MSVRDFSTIGPSARALLVMRAQTALPFARRAAELLLGTDALDAEIARIAALDGAALRLRHFTARYTSIDALLAASGASHVLELASGLAFRGLAWAQHNAGTYVDTDLPDMIATKAQLVPELAAGSLAGVYRTCALDALDAGAMRAIVDALPPGRLAIISEGLLMYLDDAEKRRLAAHVRDALVRRGGVWITADIYVRAPRDPRVAQDERLRAFLSAHRVEDNKFGSLAEAETLFTSEGFAITRRLAPSVDASRESWMLEPDLR